MSAPAIIQVALTGAQEPGPSPYLPLTPQQTVDAGLAAWRAGASVIHIHARDADGTPTQALEQFEPIVAGLREAGCDAILNLSTGSAGGRSHGADRWSCLALRPEMVSFDCGTTNFGDRVFENSPEFLRGLADAVAASGVKPEVECFEPGHIVAALALRDHGLLEGRLHFQFVLGVPGGAPATIAEAQHMRALLPADATWSICAIGRAQLGLNAYCLIEGGHVRTGLEDNLKFSREEYATNEQLVLRVMRLAELLQRPIATPAEARRILGLDPDQAEPREHVRSV